MANPIVHAGRRLDPEQVSVVLRAGARTEESAHRLRCAARHVTNQEHKKQLHEVATHLEAHGQALRKLAWLL